MEDARSAKALNAAAEQAAAAGDYPGAVAHLRDLVALNERELGPGHPDLANTLNNLGVVLERAGQPAEAEAAYRRAYAIARAAFAPDHPFVATSEANLREFCQTRGVPFEPAPPRPAVDVDREVEATVTPEPAPPAAAAPEPKQTARPATAPTPSPAARPPTPRPPARPTSRPPARPAPDARRAAPASAARDRQGFPVALGIGLAVLGAIAIGWATLHPLPTGPERPGSSRAEPAARGSTTARSDGPAPSAAAAPVEGRGAARASARGGSSPKIEVARAGMCRTLTTKSSVGPDWPCETAGQTVRPGTLAFYTRLRSAEPATVEHRWYRGQTLEQRVELRIAGNDSTGYRTYSRHTIGPDRAGEWRVELRSEDDVLLHEERFEVRER